MLDVSQVREYAPGEVIYRAGEVRGQLLLLQQGAAKIWVCQPSPLILEVVLPGEVFGEVCTSGHEPQEEQAEAISHATVRAFPVDRLLEMANGEQSALVQRLLTLYCKRASQARRWWRSSVSEDVPQRVGRRLIELLRQVPEGPGMAPVPVRLRQEDLAYLVGSTRTTVSEILNDFERRGLVELRRASFRVDRQLLRSALWPSA